MRGVLLLFIIEIVDDLFVVLCKFGENSVPERKRRPGMAKLKRYIKYIHGSGLRFCLKQIERFVFIYTNPRSFKRRHDEISRGVLPWSITSVHTYAWGRRRSWTKRNNLCTNSYCVLYCLRGVLG